MWTILADRQQHGKEPPEIIVTQLKRKTLDGKENHLCYREPLVVQSAYFLNIYLI